MNSHLRLLRQARVARWALALTVLSGFVGGVLVVAQALQLSRLIERVFLRGEDVAQVRPLLAGLLLIFAGRAAMTLLGEVCAGAVAVRVKAALRGWLVERLFELGPAYTQGEQSGELAATVVQGVDALDAYFGQYLPQIVLAALVPLTILVVVFPLDWLSGLVLLLTAPLIPIFMFLIGKASEALTRRQWGALSRMSAYFLDTLQGLTALKVLGQSQARAEKIDAVGEQYRLATLAVLRVTFLSALVLELAATLSTAVIAVQIGLRLLYGRLGFADALFVLVIAPEFYMPLRQLGARFHAGMAGVAAARRIFALLDAPPAAAPPSQPAGRSRVQPSPAALSFETLAFEAVHFAYPGGGQDALRGLSLSIGAGQQAALVGASGAGKSTVAYLLLRFGEPQGGRILVDGRPLAELPVEVWRQSIAWVPQRPFLFHDSLAANIRLGRPGASQAEVRAAARLAELDEWIETLPAGYETPVGEQGARLSGGQAQRLALARAFLRDAPFLILDEPTAHLDVAQEALIAAATQRLRQGRTTLTIAHRLSTVQHMEQIFVLEAGRVVECGAPGQLLAQGGVYARLARAGGRAA